MISKWMKWKQWCSSLNQYMLVPTQWIFPPAASGDDQIQNLPEVKMSTNQSQSRANLCWNLFVVVENMRFLPLAWRRQQQWGRQASFGPDFFYLAFACLKSSSWCSKPFLGLSLSLLLSKAFCPLFHPPAPLLSAPLDKLGRPPCDSCMVEKRRLCTCTVHTDWK